MRFLADGGLDDAAVESVAQKPACRAYTSFLLDTASREEIPEILMAVMPCMLGYYYVFDALVRKYPGVLEGYFGPLVRDYTAPGYRASCDAWTAYCNEVCEGLDGARQEKLRAIFRTASFHELCFWQMADGKPGDGKKYREALGYSGDGADAGSEGTISKEGGKGPNALVRSRVPLVHCITNYVTVNDVANALLACGGSPIMADDIDEVADITAISNALVLNIGTLNRRTIASMLKAGKTANEKGIPVVLDPVGAGASALRNEAVASLLESVRFTAIRGNLSEIAYIAGKNASARGVDSREQDGGNDPDAVAKYVAEKYGCVAAITGAVDRISDGRRVARVANGVAEMGKVTGTGCMLSGLIGAYVGACEDKFEGVVAAVASMGIAGELAWEEARGRGTGSLHCGIHDALSRIDDTLLAARGRISYD